MTVFRNVLMISMGVLLLYTGDATVSGESYTRCRCKWTCVKEKYREVCYWVQSGLVRYEECHQVPDFETTHGSWDQNCPETQGSKPCKCIEGSCWSNRYGCTHYSSTVLTADEDNAAAKREEEKKREEERKRQARAKREAAKKQAENFCAKANKSREFSDCKVEPVMLKASCKSGYVSVDYMFIVKDKNLQRLMPEAIYTRYYTICCKKVVDKTGNNTGRRIK